jgi:hypothetical protein
MKVKRARRISVPLFASAGDPSFEKLSLPLTEASACILPPILNLKFPSADSACSPFWSNVTFTFLDFFISFSRDSTLLTSRAVSTLILNFELLFGGGKTGGVAACTDFSLTLSNAPISYR